MDEVFDGRPAVGISLRDWFAGMALQGLIGHHAQIGARFEAVSEVAYRQADCMMKARDKNA